MSKNVRTTKPARPTLATAVAGDTLRLRDPKTGTWGEVVVGTKKGDKVIARVRAAQAARMTPEAVAEREAAKTARVTVKTDRALGNAKAAAWMRSEGLQPSGQAWTLVSKGERDVAVLRAANAEDGLKPVSESVRKTAKAQFKALQAGASVAEARAIRVAAPTTKATKPAKATKAPKRAAAPEVPVVEVAPAKPAKDERTKAERKAAKRRSKAGRKAYATRMANGNAVRVNGRFVSTKPAQTEQPTAQVSAPVDEFETFAAPLRTVGLTNKQIKRAWAARPGV